MTTPATRHQRHFEDLSPEDFERLVYWLVRRSGEFDEVQWYGGARDRGRDVVAYRHTEAKREKWYIQCKRYKRIGFPTLRDELDKLAEHAEKTPGFAPDVVVFATACLVPPQAKDDTAKHAQALELPAPYYWGRLELDERLKEQPETEAEFFLPTRVASPYAPVFPAEAEVGALPEGMVHRMKVFLCHASGDKPAVRQLYHRLCGEGFDPWLDEEKLLPGQDWQLEIPQAVRSSDAVVICLSRRVVTKAGYVQKEIRYALDVADEQPEGAIFLIPLRLEGCEVPQRLRRWQWVDFFDEKGYERLLRALRVRAEALGLGRHPFEPEMVLIPAGEFLMGSDTGKDEYAQKKVNEQPQHSLYLPDYYMGKTPVTNAQYVAFVQATLRMPRHWEAGKPPRGKEDHPVINVSWHDAVVYCDWLSQATGKRYCLPSEAEWEKSARVTDGLIYPWGDKWDPERCNCWEAKIKDTTLVGAYPQGASPYGLLDMAGNVREWTRSEYKAYPYDPEDGREDLDVDGSRVLRGGSWNDNCVYVRCACRYDDTPSRFGNRVGFRVCIGSRWD